MLYQRCTRTTVRAGVTFPFSDKNLVEDGQFRGKRPPPALSAVITAAHLQCAQSPFGTDLNSSRLFSVFKNI